MLMQRCVRDVVEEKAWKAGPACRQGGEGCCADQVQSQRGSIGGIGGQTGGVHL